MRMRKLGRSGYEVSELGIGTWGLGSGDWRDVEPRQAQRALYAALESGVTFIDTSPAYGESERLVGEAIHDLRARDTVVVATKVVPLPVKPGAGPGAGPAGAEPAGAAMLHRIFPPAYVTRSVEESLRSQRAEALCIVQLEAWDDAWLAATAWPELRGTMQALVKAGKVLHWGVTTPAHAPDAVLGVLGDPLIETVQVIYNIFDRAAERELFGRAAEHGVGVMARAPFDEGGLTGRYTIESELVPGDFRARYFGGRRLAELVEHVDALRPLVGGEVETLAELALRLCLSQPAVSTTVAGMRRNEHVQANIAVADSRALSADLLERLREHIWGKNWYE